MGIMSLDKPIEEVIEVMKARVKDAVVEEVPDMPIPTWTVTGDFQSFDRWEMDMWGGRMQFRLVDCRPKDAEEAEQRRETISWVPQMAGLLSATTTMQVFKEVTRVVRTTVIEDGVQREVKDGAPEKVWKDITKEFAERGQRDRLMDAQW